jgi:glycosyltransferase involved in cell wall biosynthesis
MAWTRQQSPEAAIDVLTSPGFDDAVHRAGAACVFHSSGGPFSVWRDARVLARLRRERYDMVIVPQMTDEPAHHVNLYRVAAATGASRVVVAAAERPPVTFDATAFLWFTIRASFIRLLDAIDIPLLLTLLALACCRRRSVVPQADGRRRRVLHVISSFGVGGAQVQLAELLAHTPQDHYDVEVLVLGQQDGDFSRQWLARDDVRFRYSTGWPRLSLAALELAHLCRTERYDLVHTWLFMGNVVGAAGAKLGGAPRVIGSVRNLSLWKRTWYAKWWFRLADALATRAADLVTVNATPLAADHAAWTWTRPERIVVVPNGLDPLRVTPHRPGAATWLREELALQRTTPIVGTVGRLAAEKDQAMFLRMLASARQQRPDLHAVVVGDGALRHALEQQARELELDGHVHFLGERTDSRRIIAGLDVFVLTSRIEGFPNVLLEAAFLGVPAIATAVGGAADVLDAHDLAAPGDADGMSRLMLARLAEPDAARFHAAAIRRRALEHFTAERSTTRWLALYDQLLSDKGDGL